MRLETACVLSQEELYQDTFLMWLSCPPVARGASPGRFLMIHCAEGYDPLLPRPLSFHRFRDSAGERQFAILYDVRGRGTAWLSERQAGDRLTLFGPLGRGYAVSPRAQHLLLVAGGLGVAAVVALADEAVGRGKEVTLLQGARTASKLYPPELLPKDVEVLSATDDGSAGHHGPVTDLLAGHLLWADEVFACGPSDMFRAMSQVLREARTRKPVQALLEERMGCGTGVCYGCAVFTRRGVKLVCKDGPRFELREVFPY
ncbi:MAG: dihydroorotate dehydrogenase electron transfer subunit [Dehalococcoidia bacterium]|nr:MAG: dihydroorotate dehydrogenase electron transfer subunit [Dehalococcoidia bacterium]